MKLVKTFFIAWVMTMIWSGTGYAAVSKSVGDTIEVGNIFYKITRINTTSGNTVAVDNANAANSNTYKSKYTGEITIPQKVVHSDVEYKVTGIGAQAFYDCTGLTEIDLSAAPIDSISTEAFNGCTALATINLPSTLVSIGEKAFVDCIFTDITLPTTVDSIGSNAFRRCSIETIQLNQGLRILNDRAFGNTKLKTITIPGNVTKISEYTFYNCTQLKSVTIPSSVKKIATKAFDGCTVIDTIYVHWTNFAGLTVESDVFNSIDFITTKRILIIPETTTLSDYTTYYKGTSSVWRNFHIPFRKTTNNSGTEMSTFSIPSWVTKDSFKLVTNEDYTITQSPANTVTLNRTSGTKDTTITFTFSSANTTTTPRTATLKISGGDAPERTVTVTQRKQPVDDTPISLSSAAQYFTIPVTGAWTNGTLTYGNTSGDGWINNLTTPSTSRTVSLNSTGLGSESITLHVSQNTGTTSRTATIKITVESKEYSISISQSVANKSVSPLSLNFTEAGGEANLNVYFETKSWVATTSASWLTVTPDKGSWGEGYSVKVTAVKNDLVTVNGTARTATITFKPQDLKPGDDSVQVTVRQTNPAAKLDYRPLIIKEFAWAGDSLAINITSNVVWVAEVPAPSDRTWLSVEPSTGSGNGRFIIWAKANMSDYPRSGRVRISSPASIELNRNIDITQSRIVLPPDSITFETNTQNPKVHWVTPEGGSGLVKIKFHPSTSVENQEVIWMVDKNPHLVKPLTTYSNSGCVVQGNGKEGKATLIAFLKSDYKVSAECTIDVRKTPPPVAVEPVDATSAYVTAVAPGKLTVNTPVSERISVYTVGGALLLQVQKAAGPAVVDIGLRPDVGSILIVSGESGWTQKVAVK